MLLLYWHTLQHNFLKNDKNSLFGSFCMSSHRRPSSIYCLYCVVTIITAFCFVFSPKNIIEKMSDVKYDVSFINC